MNERIKKLAEQCWDRRLDGLHFDQEQFAELIIQECLLALEPDWYGTEIEYNVEQKLYHRSANLIKQHFGIEE